MFRILPRYLGAQFILPFSVSALFFVMFLLIFQLFRVVSLVVNKGVSLTLVIELLYHIAVTFLPISIPLSVLFATMFTLNRMSEDSEVLVMRSLGISRLKLFAPFLAVGTIIAVVIFVFNSQIIPHSKRESRRIVTLLTSKGFLADIKAKSFYIEIPGLTIYSEEVGDEGKELDRVFIHLQDSKKAFEQVIFAQKGILVKDIDQREGLNNLSLHLFDGNIVKNFADRLKSEKIFFKEYKFPVPTGDLSASFATKDSMLSSTELYKIMQLNDRELKAEKISKEDLARTKIEYWTRINTAVSCLLFTFIGFGLGIQNARGKRRNTSLLCLVVLVGYYAIFFAGVSFAKKGGYPAHLAVFTPTFLGLIFGSRLFKKLEWIA